ncbi:MAG: hypothetical protein IH987_08055, partial [Planctomycetes bacterium]|nr:hypothetical protein [Planctomycetota bacterium]
MKLGYFSLVMVVLACNGAIAQDPPASRKSGNSASIVYLDKSRGWALFTARGSVHRGILSREIARQAFLIAARDELGLTTRDAWLGEAMPSAGKNEPFDLAAIPGGPSRYGVASMVEVLRGFYPTEESVDHFRLDVIGKVNSQPTVVMDYQSLVVEMEKLSRTRFVEALKTSGFKPSDDKKAHGDAVPSEAIEDLLQEMTFTSQFSALRQLHAAIYRQGESAELLGALVRGYANLGLLSEPLWHPSHKVFKARALLYAQRLRVREANSRWARRHNAYALAFASLHGKALADLDDVDGDSDDEKEPSKNPEWTDLIRACCRFDLEGLDPDKAPPAHRDLARLLRYLAIEHADERTLTVKSALEALQFLPECYRIQDGVCKFGGVKVMHSATFASFLTMARN